MDNATKTAHVRYQGKQVIIAAPYDGDFVADLKSSVKSRKWDPKRRVWLVDIGERREALEVTGRFFSVVEDNAPGEKPQRIDVEAAGLSDTGITAEWLGGEDLEMWVDGACLGNPGPGGYGIVFSCGGEKKAKAGGFRLTTNNRMEITAAIVALETIGQRRRLVIHSDSQYVVDAMKKGWARRWRSNKWMRNKNEKAVNPDLWERLLRLCEQHDVEFRWVRGHNAQTENEWCDQLAQAAARRPGLPVDPGYERGGEALV